MLDFFKGLISEARDPGPAPRAPRVAAPAALLADGAPPLPLAPLIKPHNGFPILDWEAVRAWLDQSASEAQRATAWTQSERAWLLHFRDALGAAFRLDEGRTAMVLSSLEPGAANAALAYMERTLKRIGAVLDGIALAPEWGKDLLILLDDQAQYYDYVSYYYPERGEFAFSGGMHIHSGCSHFVTTKGDLRALEPTIAHEMTHGCLAHLPIPAWLNEGIAVNTEHRLAGAGHPLYTAAQMHAKHQRFWGEAEIQQFWSGKSFERPDEGNMLSYDLARILVDQFSRQWDRFSAFVREASFKDAGAEAARTHLDLPLGAAVTAVLEFEPSPAWEPNPQVWEGEAERGAFKNTDRSPACACS